MAVQQQLTAFGSSKLLFDGQQHLTSLSTAVRGEPLRFKNRVRPVEIAFNLDHPDVHPAEVMEVDEERGGNEA